MEYKRDQSKPEHNCEENPQLQEYLDQFNSSLLFDDNPESVLGTLQIMDAILSEDFSISEFNTSVIAQVIALAKIKVPQIQEAALQVLSYIGTVDDLVVCESFLGLGIIRLWLDIISFSKNIDFVSTAIESLSSVLYQKPITCSQLEGSNFYKAILFVGQKYKEIFGLNLLLLNRVICSFECSAEFAEDIKAYILHFLSSKKLPKKIAALTVVAEFSFYQAGRAIEFFGDMESIDTLLGFAQTEMDGVAKPSLSILNNFAFKSDEISQLIITHPKFGTLMPLPNWENETCFEFTSLIWTVLNRIIRLNKPELMSILFGNIPHIFEAASTLVMNCSFDVGERASIAIGEILRLKNSDVIRLFLSSFSGVIPKMVDIAIDSMNNEEIIDGIIALVDFEWSSNQFNVLSILKNERDSVEEMLSNENINQAIHLKLEYLNSLLQQKNQ